jgi:RHH-type transcriptional regulator, rel operon repressor / antitoxin RelB
MRGFLFGSTERILATQVRYTCIAMLAIRLTTEIEERLDRLAKRTGRTKTAYAREAILRHLDDLEDREDLAMAARIAADVRAGREKTFSMKEVLRDHGLELGVDRHGAPKLKKARPRDRKSNSPVSRRKTRAV